MNSHVSATARRLRPPTLTALITLLLVLVTACQPTPPPPLPTATPLPTPTAKVGPAVLRVDVQPYGAMVSLDGSMQASSPLTLTVEPGAHALLIEEDGFAPLQETLVLEPGGEAMIAGMLTDVEPPELALLLSEDTVLTGETVAIAAEVSDNVGVKRLEILLDGQPLAEGAGGQEAVEVAWTPETAGTYTLLARAVDAAGNSSEQQLPIAVAGPPSPTPTGTPTASPTAVPPTPTPTLGPTSTPTPAMTAEVMVDRLNMRTGPGTGFDRMGVVERGQQLTVLGRDQAADWLNVCCLDGQAGWVSSKYLQTDRPVEEVPLASDIPQSPAGTPVSSTEAAVTVDEHTVSLSTYPYAEFLREAVDSAHGNVPLKLLDWTAYRASDPQPASRDYQLAVLENEFLRLTLLPELGGRIYECIFKPTGHNQFYRNPVIKPTHWGPSSPEGANWWLAAGGLEWGLPVEEHGYEWGLPWSYRIVRGDDGSATVRLADGEGERLVARVAVTLRPGEASFGVQTTLENQTRESVRYQFWNNAMLAPGSGNRLSEGLQFVFPAAEMTVHSSGDHRLGGAGSTFSWPVHEGRDVSFLRTWQGHLGFFVPPASQRDFAGVYDHVDDEGIVRVYPSTTVRGVKGFAFGWGDAAVGADNWTDDGSGYVEVHGGVSPTFADWAELGPGQSIAWKEVWFPVAGLGGVLYANEQGALNVRAEDGHLRVGVFSTRRRSGLLIVLIDDQRVYAEEITAGPEMPLDLMVPLAWDLPSRAQIELAWVHPTDGAPILAMPPQDVTLEWSQ